ncbi:BolA family protein [Sulfuricella sp.]|uniref:BolA family protein n=1 Tax=Sulfuricella sp. TaxID=2099377 RepID=UPI002C41ED55|nr:BolA family protein [Sulfuricella sp.]HUX63597.1 BolA family protein [Sulfuricella sp.]
MSTPEKIRERLASLSPERLEIEDESARHAGHEGAKSGGGHYRLTIVSAQFADKSLIARHRMINELLGEMLQKEIHAISIKAYTPGEN